MAPMIDVVFLLLIFFMCTSAIKAIEDEIRTDLPRTGAGKAERDEDFDAVRIRLTGTGKAVLVACDGQPCATFDALTAMLKARRAIGDVPAIIQGESGVPFGYMVGALDACHRADLHRVAFAPTPVEATTKGL